MRSETAKRMRTLLKVRQLGRTLRVEGETAAGAVAVVLRAHPGVPIITLPCEVLEGITDESDAAFVADSLHAVYSA